MSQTEAPVITPYVEDPKDACLTAAYKLQVVIHILLGIEDDDSDGGWGVTTVTDLVTEIQAALRASAANAQSEPPETRTGGAQ